MVSVNFIRKNFRIPLLLFLVAVILIILVSFYYLNTGISGKNTSQNTEVSNLQNYDKLINQIAELQNDPDFKQEALIQRSLQKIYQIKNNKLSNQQKYDTLKVAYFFLITLYSHTNNPKVRPIFDTYKDFVKVNFPTNYAKSNNFFSYLCQDTTCQETPQPPEILKIVNDIKQSDLDENVKASVIQDLLNPGYLPKNQNQFKFDNYILSGSEIRSYAQFTKTNANITISDEIYFFLKKAYPKEYEQALKSPNAVKIGLK